MLIIEAKDLETQGVLYQGANEFVFQGKVMVSGLAFSMRLLQTAIDLCQEELDTGNFCMLVKNFNYITICKEKQIEQTEKKDSPPILPTLAHQFRKAKPGIGDEGKPKPGIGDEPELPMAGRLSEDSLQQFLAQINHQPLVRQSLKSGNAIGPPAKRETLNQKNGAAANPIRRAHGESTSQSIQSSKPIEPSPLTPSLNTPAPEAEPPAELDPTFLEHCQQVLAYCIGPIASLILEEVLAKGPPSSPNQLINSLAEEIPNPQAAREFRLLIKSM